MAKHVIVGCAGLPPRVGWSRYFKRLPYVEVAALHTGPVRPSVLRRWRAAAPRAGAFGVVAPALITHSPGPRGYGSKGWPVPAGGPSQVGGFRITEPVAAAVTALIEACDLLDAATAVFRSPPDFSPSQANRDALLRFFAEVATAERFAGRRRVWHPGGLWDPPTAQKVATEAGVLCAHDPLGADPERRFVSFWTQPVNDDGYFVVSGHGRARRRTSIDQLEELVEIAARHERAWVVFATTDPVPDAIRFTRLVTDHAAEAEMLDTDDPDPIDESGT